MVDPDMKPTQYKGALTAQEVEAAWSTLQAWATNLAEEARPMVEAMHARADACRVEVILTPEQEHWGADEAMEPPGLYDVVASKIAEALGLHSIDASELVCILLPDDEDEP